MRWWVEWVSGSLAAGAALFAVGALFHITVPVVAPGIPAEFANLDLFRPWVGWTSTYMALHPFVYGFVFAAVFLGLRRWSAFPPGVRGGLVYGVGLFVVGSLPVYLLAFASFQVSPEVIFSWMTQSLSQYALAGMTLGCVCDGAAVRVSKILLAPASRVWELLLLKDSFLYVTSGMMSYTDTEQWPARLFTEGMTLTTRVRLFGFGPSSPHKVEVVRVNGAHGEIETKECGGLVRVWNHRMRVEPVSEVKCRYTDSIEVQAGLLTPVVWLFAALFYRHRQRRWQYWLQASAVAAEPLTAADGGRNPGSR